MKIKYLSGPKAGQFDHAPNTQETQLLVKTGLIEIVRYTNFIEYMSREHAQPAAQPKVEWFIKDIGIGRYSKVEVGMRVINGPDNVSTAWFDAPPANCPPEIVARWKQLAIDTPKLREESAIKLAADRKKMEEDQERDKHANAHAVARVLVGKEIFV